MATVRVEYYGMDGEGRNVTEAKRDAGRKIEAALSGTYTPEIVTWRGVATIVYREPSGWHYRHIADPVNGLRDGRVWGMHCGTYEDAIRRARYNVAQDGWQPDDGTDAPEFVHKDDRGEFRRWTEFQLRCRRAVAAGLTGLDMHDYAGLNPGRRDLTELISRVEGEAKTAPAVA